MVTDTIALIPAHNEEKTIKEVILRLKSKNPHPSIMPIVVDDHSTDKTYQIAKNEVIVIRNRNKKGKGETLKTGLRYILTHYPNSHVVFIDGDLQYLPEDAKKLVGILVKGNYDVVFGYRYKKDIPYRRHKLGNAVWNFLFNLRYKNKIHIEDLCCGLIVISNEALRRINLNKLSGGYTIDASIRIETIRNNFKIKQVPVKVIYKRKSSLLRGIRIVAGVSIFMILNFLSEFKIIF